MEKRISGSKVFPKKTAMELLDMYYLEARSALLETAAIFDRIDRASGREELEGDIRLQQLKQSFDLLKSSRPDRAKAFLKLLSESVESDGGQK